MIDTENHHNNNNNIIICTYIIVEVLWSSCLIQVMKFLPSVRLMTSENSPQSIFMKTIVHPNDLNFEPAPPQSLIDRTKAVIISSV